MWVKRGYKHERVLHHCGDAFFVCFYSDDAIVGKASRCICYEADGLQEAIDHDGFKHV